MRIRLRKSRGIFGALLLVPWLVGCEMLDVLVAEEEAAAPVGEVVEKSVPNVRPSESVSPEEENDHLETLVENFEKTHNDLTALSKRTDSLVSIANNYKATKRGANPVSNPTAWTDAIVLSSDQNFRPDSTFKVSEKLGIAIRNHDQVSPKKCFGPGGNKFQDTQACKQIINLCSTDLGAKNGQLYFEEINDSFGVSEVFLKEKNSSSSYSEKSWIQSLGSLGTELFDFCLHHARLGGRFTPRTGYYGSGAPPEWVLSVDNPSYREKTESLPPMAAFKKVCAEDYPGAKRLEMLRAAAESGKEPFVSWLRTAPSRVKGCLEQLRKSCRDMQVVGDRVIASFMTRECEQREATERDLASSIDKWRREGMAEAQILGYAELHNRVSACQIAYDQGVRWKYKEPVLSCKKLPAAKERSSSQGGNSAKRLSSSEDTSPASVRPIVRGGAAFGLNLANVSLSPSTSTSSKTGIAVGPLFDFNLGSNSYLQIELLYSEYGYNEIISGTNLEVAYTVFEIPIIAKYRFDLEQSPFHPLLLFGSSMAFRISTAATSPSGITDLSSATQSFGTSLIFGTGFEYELKPNEGIFLNLRYLLGLTNLSKTSVAAKHATFQFLVGYIASF